jgi:hypothetical protein
MSHHSRNLICRVDGVDAKNDEPYVCVLIYKECIKNASRRRSTFLLLVGLVYIFFSISLKMLFTFRLFMNKTFFQKQALKTLSLAVLIASYLSTQQSQAQVYQESHVPVFVNMQDENNDKFIDKLEFYHYSDSLMTYKSQEIISPHRPFGYSQVEYVIQTKYVYDLQARTVTEIVKKEDFLGEPKLLHKKTIPITDNHRRDLNNSYFLTTYPSRMFVDFDDFNFKSLQAIEYNANGEEVTALGDLHKFDEHIVALGAEPYYTNPHNYSVITQGFDATQNGRPDSIKISYINPVGLEMCTITRIDEDNDGFVNYDLICVNRYNSDGVLQEQKIKRHNLTGRLE